METLTEDRSRPAEAVRPADGTGQRVSLRRLFWIFFIFVPLTSKIFEKIIGTSPKSPYKTKKTTNRFSQRFIVLLVRSRELESLAL